MPNEGLLVIRIISGLLFLSTLAGGAWLMHNYERLFGADPALPSENDSARAYSKVQVFTLWLHVFFLFGAFAVLSL